MIQSQMSACWRIDAGAQSAKDMVVKIRVRLNPDGSVIGQPMIQNGSRMANDSFYRSAAENARRAILECQPFQLPRQDYELWQDLVLKFDPREMF
jgi:hypothetical protein